jgi:hypothetical protein
MEERMFTRKEKVFEAIRSIVLGILLVVAVGGSMNACETGKMETVVMNHEFYGGDMY